MKYTFPITAICAVTISALILSGCGGGAEAKVDTGQPLVLDGEQIADASLYEAAIEDQKVVVYSGAGEKSQTLTDESFTEDTGIEVESINLSPSRLKERILSENGAGQFPGEVVIISDASTVKELDDAEIFAPYELPADYGIDNEAIHEDGKYFTAYYPAYTIAYNTAATDSPPTSWKDLLKPEYKDQIGIVNAGVGGSAATLTRFQLDVLGEDYLRQYVKNGARVFDTMAAEAEAMGRGELITGSMTAGNAYRSAEDGAPMAPIVPKEGLAVYDYFAGVTSEGEKSAAAKLYMNWYFSKQGQMKQVEEGTYSVRKDVDTPSFNEVSMPKLDSDLVYRISPEEAVEAKDEDLALWNKIFNVAG